eukprot:355627-Chlamydomonas_euryale.AAC.19
MARARVAVPSSASHCRTESAAPSAQRWLVGDCVAATTSMKPASTQQSSKCASVCGTVAQDGGMRRGDKMPYWARRLCERAL